MVENKEIIYIYRKYFRSVYVYADGSDKICRESLHSIYESLNNNFCESQKIYHKYRTYKKSTDKRDYFK